MKKFALLPMFGCILAIWPLRMIIAYAASPQPPQDPTLNAVNVTFELPKCDDRDNDTRIKMWVTNGATTIAEDDNVAWNQQFSDPGTYGPYSLPLRNTITKSAWGNTKTNIHIEPNGHDTWCTKFHVDALFSDNTHIKSNNCSVIKISESNKDYTFNTTSCLE